MGGSSSALAVVVVVVVQTREGREEWVARKGALLWVDQGGANGNEIWPASKIRCSSPRTVGCDRVDDLLQQHELIVVEIQLEWVRCVYSALSNAPAVALERRRCACPWISSRLTDPQGLVCKWSEPPVVKRWLESDEDHRAKTSSTVCPHGGSLINWQISDGLMQMLLAIKFNQRVSYLEPLENTVVGLTRCEL